ncbi:IMP cyclohydrolase [Pelagicoccus sp. SDUM812005]|uniref:IMP cyclohydrolase n=1 Tax=Pelagicoccus sp. SDUM812005 TaxID=3041257 RepID=UPI00280E27F5|nr:IMP cyclohydrolase [Pelagicoccus sp. SDUM812005]MDQ8179645.1 IMP cyclohydrolase [Pelagicoccus sp. SDUM812005]
MSASEIASATLQSHVAGNPYPGRGLVIGKSASGDAWQQVYWIMGRSPNSRNRQFSLEGATLSTEPFDPSKVEDPSLIIYEAMLELPGQFLVSNGDQTRTLCDGLAAGKTAKEALSTRDREPDAPNYTPRITGQLDLTGDSPEIGLSILKANKIDPKYSDRHYYYPQEPANGIGYGLTTYMGDGNPLPTFNVDPLLLPIAATPEETLELYWSALDEDNRISLAVKEIALDGSSSRVVLRNKYTK